MRRKSNGSVAASFKRSKLSVKEGGTQASRGLILALSSDGVPDEYSVAWEFRESIGARVETYSYMLSETENDWAFCVHTEMQSGYSRIFVPYASLDTDSTRLTLSLTLWMPPRRIADREELQQVSAAKFEVSVSPTLWDPVEQWHCLIGIAVAMGKVDGPLTSHDVKLMREWFGKFCDTSNHEEQLRVALKQFNSMNGLGHVSGLLEDANLRLFSGRWAGEFLDFLGELAYADGQLGESELAFFTRVHRGLSIDEDELADRIEVLRRFGHARDVDSSEGFERRFESIDPFVVLGVGRSCDQKAVSEAYRSLVMVYHPDKVVHLAPEYRLLAERRLKAINVAFEKLKRAAE